ncbi:hypothetical protein ILYODFUR_033767 [Ilyodon furcidens]|uniref:Uncharacterized protein n=1 Tax=Ilyodon furcidens TaxID=33524 RepID=A0ABV0U0D7_9TELE
MLETPKWATLNRGAGNLPYFFRPPPPIRSGAYFKYFEMYSSSLVVVVSNELKTVSEEGRKNGRSILANTSLSVTTKYQIGIHQIALCYCIIYQSTLNIG